LILVRIELNPILIVSLLFGLIVAESKRSGWMFFFRAFTKTATPHRLSEKVSAQNAKIKINVLIVFS